MPKPLMPWCAVSVVALLLGGLPEGLKSEPPRVNSESPTVLLDRKGGSPLDKLDRAQIPNKVSDSLPKEVVAVLNGYGGGGGACAFSPDGRSFAATAGQGRVKLWTLGDARAEEGQVFQSGHDFIDALAFRPGLPMLAVARWNGQVELWNLAGPSPTLSCVSSDKVFVVSMAFSPDGTYLATGTFDDDDLAVRLWRVEGKKLQPHTTLVQSKQFDKLWRGPRRVNLAFSADSRMLVTAGHGPTVLVWELATGKERLRLTGTGKFNAVGFSRDGRRVVAASFGGPFNAWDAATGLVLPAPGRDQIGRPGPFLLTAPADLCFASWSAPIAGRLTRLQICVEGGKEIVELEASGDYPAAAWSADGRHLGLANDDGRILIFRLAR